MVEAAQQLRRDDEDARRRGDGVQRIGGGRGGGEGQRPPCRVRVEAEHRPAPCPAIQHRTAAIDHSCYVRTVCI